MGKATYRITPRIIHRAYRLDLLPHLGQTVLQVDETVHGLFELLVDVRNVSVERFVDALLVVL